MKLQGRWIALTIVVLGSVALVVGVFLPELELFHIRRTSTTTGNLEQVAVVHQIKKNASTIATVKKKSTTTTTSVPTTRKRYEPYYRSAATILNNTENHTFGGVQARVFPRNTVPCLEPEATWKTYDTQMTPTQDGFLFLKTYKTGSSTASGINLRIARNVAQRQKTGYEICKTRYDHAWASSLYKSLDREKSFLWTIVRDPVSRTISQLFHFHVSRAQNPSTDESLIGKIRESPVMFHNYYMGSLPRQQARRNRDPVVVANEILRQYDFIAVTERMDESAVALAMLLGLPLGDILYLKAKGNGGYDDAGGKRNICTFIQPSFVSTGMEEFFRSNEYQEMVKWDYPFYLAANRSLDLTIDALGREQFEKKLAQFQAAQKRAVERCQSVTRFPCTSTGERNEETDCLWNDSGCGYECLDEVASELDLKD
uniref:Sulfotransferase domain-containing protein n=1 Tax=Amphora coffeiformis TaxID=265554 RepID=A0A7S3LFF1_9STRA